MAGELAGAGDAGASLGAVPEFTLGELVTVGDAAVSLGVSLESTLGELVGELATVGDTDWSAGLALGLLAGTLLGSAVRLANWGERKVFVSKNVPPTAANTARIAQTMTGFF